MKYLVLVLTSLALAASTSLHHSGKLDFPNFYKKPINEKSTKLGIVNGQEAVPHSLPYQVLLLITKNESTWYCGGSLISQNYVLTSAWCAYGGLHAEIILGAHSIVHKEDTQVSVTTDHITVHENYDDDLYAFYNIAVLKLPSPISLTDAIQPVRLPSRSDENNQYIGIVAKASGWGLTSADGSHGVSMTDVLYYVYLEVISNEECRDMYGGVDHTMMCTSGKDHTGTCWGDSGGPLVTNNVQIGVISFQTCEPGTPSGYIRVTSFLDWIQEHSDVVIS